MWLCASIRLTLRVVLQSVLGVSLCWQWSMCLQHLLNYSVNTMYIPPLEHN